MAEKPPIDFVSRRRELLEKRKEENQNPPEEVSQKEAPKGAEVVALLVHREPWAPSAPAMPGDFTMRMFSRHNSRFGADISIFGDLIGNTEDAQKKFTRLVELDSALDNLRTQMSARREAENVAMRRGPMRSDGTENLEDMFWNSNEHDWAARPSTYIALLDELEERGFFALRSLDVAVDRRKQPPTPREYDRPDIDPDDDNPRSPGRPHRGRPKR